MFSVAAAILGGKGHVSNSFDSDFLSATNYALPLRPINHDFSCWPLPSRRVRMNGFGEEYGEEQRLFVVSFEKQTPLTTFTAGEALVAGAFSPVRSGSMGRKVRV
ncbi:hypothetical protein OH764_34415 (plasmid) [Burkholderia sp. M6-3]